MKLKILLTGGRGQLGKEISKKLCNATIYSYDRDKLDITNENHIKNIFQHHKPNILINTAAYTDVNKAEIDKENAENINSKAVKMLAKYCKIYNTLFIHFSTDYVFSGNTKKPYLESDEPDPINFYGITKLNGERYLQKSGTDYIIFRTSWLYGDSKLNFVNKIAVLIKKKNELFVTSKEQGSPTPTTLIVDVLNDLIKFDKLYLIKNRIINLCSTGYVSRYDLANEILKIQHKHNLNKSQTKISIQNNQTKVSVRRPAFSALDNTFIQEKISFKILYWKKYLQNYLG